MLIIQRETGLFTDIYVVTHFSLLSLINLHPNQLHLFNQVSRFTRNIFNSMANMGLSFRCRRLGFSPVLICVCYHDNFLNSLCLGFLGFPGGASGKEPTCQCRRHKRPWRREWQLTLVFLLEESRGQRNLAGYSP